MPIEAAELHAALRDAETGKAQHENGKDLDVVVDSNAPSASASQVDLSQLRDGEVVKLPPLPSQTDGTEQVNDPQTSAISHSDDHSDHSLPGYPAEKAGIASAYPVDKPAAPPLPMRTASTGPLLPPRPVVRQFSSQSHYSTDDGGEAAGLPPAYEEEGGVSAGHGEAQGARGPTGAELEQLEMGPANPSRSTAGMTEAERAEWEEHWKQEDDAVLAKQLEAIEMDSAAVAPVSGQSAVPKPAAREDESLR